MWQLLHIIEGGVLAHVGPVHAAHHVRLERAALVDQLEDVLRAGRYIVEEDDGCAGGQERGSGGGRGASRERGESEVAQIGETGDTVARQGIDGGRLEMIRDALAGESELQSRENFPSAVIAVAFYDGEHARLRAQEANNLDDGPEQAREDRGSLPQTQGKEVLRLRL